MAGAEEFGFSQEQLDEWEAGWADVEKENSVDVWQDNWRALEVFLACQTQWRTAGMSGVRIGLDYAGVKAVLDMFRVKKKLAPALFDDIRAMEYEALAVFGEKARSAP